MFIEGGKFWSLIKIKLMLLPQSTYCAEGVANFYVMIIMMWWCGDDDDFDDHDDCKCGATSGLGRICSNMQEIIKEPIKEFIMSTHGCLNTLSVSQHGGNHNISILTRLYICTRNHGYLWNFDEFHGSLNVPIEHHPTIRYMIYNGYYKVMSNIPKMGQLPTPEFWGFKFGKSAHVSSDPKRRESDVCMDRSRQVFSLWRKGDTGSTPDLK